jgi:uncharacterized protein YjcR
MALSNYEKKRVARNLFLRGEEQKIIAESLGLSENTVTAWRREGDWDKDRDKMFNTINLSMEIVANLALCAHKESQKEDCDIDKMNKYATAIDRFTPPRDEFELVNNIGKSITHFLVQTQKSKEEINDFIATYREFSKWYINS